MSDTSQKSETSKKQIEVAIVLQGGGALGAYECGGVIALLELMDEAQAAGRSVALKSVVGVSIGAVNAACVVGAADRADARRRIGELWDDLTLTTPEFWPRQAQRDLSLFGLPGFYWPRSDFLRFPQWTSYYDTSPLRATLERHVDFKALNGSGILFVISAVDVESGMLKRFPIDPTTAHRRLQSWRTIFWRAAACRRNSPGRGSKAATIGTAGSSTMRRSATPLTAFRAAMTSIACWW